MDNFLPILVKYFSENSLVYYNYLIKDLSRVNYMCLYFHLLIDINDLITFCLRLCMEWVVMSNKKLNEMNNFMCLVLENLWCMSLNSNNQGKYKYIQDDWFNTIISSHTYTFLDSKLICRIFYSGIPIEHYQWR